MYQIEPPWNSPLPPSHRAGQQEQGNGAHIEIETCTTRLRGQKVAIDKEFGLQTKHGIGPTIFHINQDQYETKDEP